MPCGDAKAYQRTRERRGVEERRSGGGGGRESGRVGVWEPEAARRGRPVLADQPHGRTAGVGPVDLWCAAAVSASGNCCLLLREASLFGARFEMLAASRQRLRSARVWPCRFVFLRFWACGLASKRWVYRAGFVW